MESKYGTWVKEDNLDSEGDYNLFSPKGVFLAWTQWASHQGERLGFISSNVAADCTGFGPLDFKTLLDEEAARQWV